MAIFRSKLGILFFVQNTKFHDFIHFSTKTNWLCPWQLTMRALTFGHLTPKPNHSSLFQDALLMKIHQCLPYRFNDRTINLLLFIITIIIKKQSLHF